MGYDLILKNGTVIDGTGAPGKRADVAIAGGKIAEIGKLDGNGARAIDAGGMIVAPGIIDIHCHYDAQVCWDPLLGSSSEFGSTTVIQGNCGIGVAPCKEKDRETTLQDLLIIEALSYDVLSKGMVWEFETFPEYLDQVRRRGIGINLGAFVPLTPLRRWTMGDDVSERAATAAERTEIAANLRAAMEAGAIGFSSTIVKRQIGYKGRPLGCLLADWDELDAYTGVLRDLKRGVIEVNACARAGDLTDDEYAFLDKLGTLAEGRLTYGAAPYRNSDPEAVVRMLNKVEPLRKRGIMPQTKTRPVFIDIDFRNPYFLSDCPAFKSLLGQPIEDQKRAYADPAWRAQAREQLAGGGKNFSGSWLDGTIVQVGHDVNKQYLNKTIREIAAARGKDPFETMLDLVLEDDLQLKLSGGVYNSNPEHMRNHLKDPRVILGAGDGGAHVDMYFESNYGPYMLGYWVREQQAMDLEFAIKRMTSEPADYFGIKDRGRLQPGKAADTIVFDPKTIGTPLRPDQLRTDLPGGGRRLYSSVSGMEYVIVNGEVVYDHGKPTGALPGKIVDGR